MTLEIRKAKTEDIPQLMSLFNSYVTPNRPESGFHWWNATPSVTFCAITEQELVGMFKVLRRRLTNNLNCGVLMGLLVKSEWRGRGLFKELGTAAMDYFEDIDLFCCLTSLLGKKALEKNFEFKAIDNIETMVLADSISLTADDNDSRSYTYAPITSNTRFYNLTKKGEKDVVMFLADDKFRNWRFALHHLNSYEMIKMNSDEFIVANKYHDKEKGIRYGDIVDFEPLAFDEEQLTGIFKSACLSLRKDVDMVTIQAIPNSVAYKAAKRIGFIESSMKHIFCVKVKDPRNEYLYNPSNWLIKWGDYLR